MRRIGKQGTRKLFKTGKQSIAVTLSIEIVRNLKWREKQKVVVKRSGGKVIIEDWKK